MSEKFITVYTNILIPPVDIVKSVFESEGIMCNVKGHDETRPQLSFGTGIELQVREEDVKKAKKIISELDIK